MGWNYISAPKLYRLHCWSLGMMMILYLRIPEKQSWLSWSPNGYQVIHPTYCNGCSYLSMLRLKLIHVPWEQTVVIWIKLNKKNTSIRYFLSTCHRFCWNRVQIVQFDQTKNVIKHWIRKCEVHLRIIQDFLPRLRGIFIYILERRFHELLRNNSHD